MADNPDEGEVRSLLRGVSTELAVELAMDQMSQLMTHFVLLMKWNRKINLTSVRHPEEIAWRHFGESVFAVEALGLGHNSGEELLIDVGSGAGFPGLPIKILCPTIRTILLEPNHKKAAFLKEVIRQNHLRDIQVRLERVEDFTEESLPERASLVTMRAVAWSDELLTALSSVTKPGGRVALFLGLDDATRYQNLTGYIWESPLAIPHSERRVILVGTRISD